MLLQCCLLVVRRTAACRCLQLSMRIFAFLRSRFSLALRHPPAAACAELAAELAAAVGAAGRDAVTAEGHTALHLAARAGHVATTYALLEAKCSAVGECVCVCVESPAVFALLCPSETHPQSAACHFSVRRGCAAACCNQPLGVCAFLSLGAHTFPSPAACTPRAAQTHIPLPRPPCAVADGRGWTALHYVALRGDLALFNMLFSPTAPHLTPAAGWLVGWWAGGWVGGWPAGAMRVGPASVAGQGPLPGLFICTISHTLARHDS